MVSTDDPDVVCGSMVRARGAGAGVQLIWYPWYEVGDFFLSLCFFSPPLLLPVFPCTPSCASQSSCLSLQLLRLHVPLLKKMQFPATTGGGAGGIMALLGDPAGGPGSLFNCG